MKVGDKVRVLRVPEAVTDSAAFPTRTTLLQCIGREFAIIGFQHVEDLEHVLVELHVGEVVGKAPHAETIWVEADCVELVT
jgi:hypothetical protein